MLAREREKDHVRRRRRSRRHRHPLLFFLLPFLLLHLSHPCLHRSALLSGSRVYLRCRRRRCRHLCSRCDFMLDHARRHTRDVCWAVRSIAFGPNVCNSDSKPHTTHTHLRSPCIYVRKHINGHAWLRDSKRTRSAKDTAQCTCAYLNTRTRVCSALVEDTVTHALSDSRGTKEEEEKEAPGGGMSVRMRFRCSAMSC